LPEPALSRDGICVQPRGEGATVLLIHGFGTSSFTWRHIMRPLAARLRVLAPDLLGVGCPARPRRADYSLEAHVERLEALLNEMAIEGARVVGHSFGGSMALLLAARHPHRVSRLALLAPAAFVERYPLLVRVLRSPVLGPLAMWVPARGAARLALRRAYADPSRITPEAVPGYARDLGDRRVRRALRATAIAFSRTKPERLREVLAGIHPPTLILWGREDRILPPSQGESLQLALPHARLILVAGAGHALHEERPDAVLDALLPFLLND
jgi:pimeloyl-ACP methyl ester carboxylesterase